MKKNEKDIPEIPDWMTEESLDELTNGKGEDEDDE